MRRRKLIPTVTVVALVVVAIIGVTSATGGAQKPLTPARAATAPFASAHAIAVQAVRGGTLPQEQLLRAIIAGVAPRDLTAAQFGAPPNGFGAAPELQEFGSTWLYLTLNASSASERDQIAQYWQAMLIAGAFRDRAHNGQLPDLLGYSIQFRYPDGTTSPEDSSVIGRPFDVPSAATATTIANTVRQRAGTLVHVLGAPQVAFVHPSFPAPIITVSSDDPASLLASASGGLAAHLLGATSPYEGAIIQLLDSKGNVISISAYSTRAGTGLEWNSPQFSAGEPHLGGVLGSNG